MRRAFPLILIAFAFITCFHAPSALGQFNIISCSRNLGVGNASSTAGGLYNQSEASGGPVYYDGGEWYIHSGASQDSTVSSGDFSGTGTAEVDGFVINSNTYGAQATGASYYQAVFSVSSPTAVALTGNFYGADYWGNSDEPSILSSSVSLSNTNATLYSLTETTPQSLDYSYPISFSATLEPGTNYTLTAQTSTNVAFGPYAESDSDFNSNFNFSLAVPEPASGSLFSAGAALMLARRHRRKHALN